MSRQFQGVTVRVENYIETQYFFFVLLEFFLKSNVQCIRQLVPKYLSKYHLFSLQKPISKKVLSGILVCTLFTFVLCLPFLLMQFLWRGWRTCRKTLFWWGEYFPRISMQKKIKYYFIKDKGEVETFLWIIFYLILFNSQNVWWKSDWKN